MLNVRPLPRGLIESDADDPNRVRVIYVTRVGEGHIEFVPRRLVKTPEVDADKLPLALPASQVGSGVIGDPLRYQSGDRIQFTSDTAGQFEANRIGVLLTPANHKIRVARSKPYSFFWEVPQVGPVDGKRVAGILGTAGGLLFYGDPSGYFVAADERTGKTVWRLPLNATIKTSPMTYAVGGTQYVALAVGSNIMCFGLAP